MRAVLFSAAGFVAALVAAGYSTRRYTLKGSFLSCQ
jgi:hypothetical protein